MGKQGTPFEKAVRDIASLMDPGAKVTQGNWIDGPDCRRDADVLIEGAITGVPFKGIIECKDYAKSKSGPVGIELVEQLDSKRQDFDFNFACICSNAGFTKGALSKAKRVSIGLIGAMRSGDKRIKNPVVDDFYTRRVNVKHINLALALKDKPVHLNSVPFGSLLYSQMRVGDWVSRHVMQIVASNPIVNGPFQWTYQFKRELVFEYPHGRLNADTLITTFTLSGAWFHQLAELSATTAVYDWVRRHAWMAPGLQSLSVKLDTTGGKQVKCPPPEDLLPIAPPGMHIKPILINGLKFSEPVVDLDPLICESDLDVNMKGLPVSCCESSSDFTWSWDGWTIRKD